MTVEQLEKAAFLGLARNEGGEVYGRIYDINIIGDEYIAFCEYYNVFDQGLWNQSLFMTKEEFHNQTTAPLA